MNIFEKIKLTCWDRRLELHGFCLLLLDQTPLPFMIHSSPNGFNILPGTFSLMVPFLLCRGIKKTYSIYLDWMQE
jgi:hypothetical protein